MKIIPTSILFLFLITACSIRPPAKPPVTRYYLEPDVALTCKPPRNQHIMKLRFINGVSSALTQHITYKKSDFKTGSYLYSRWDQSPNRSIMTQLYTAFKESDIFTQVVYENSPVKSDLGLQIKVLRFEHHFEDEENSSALIELDATLYNSRTHQLVASRLFRSEVQAKTNNAQGGVIAFNQAVGDILSTLICWTAKQSNTTD